MLRKLESVLCGLGQFRGTHEGESCYIFGDGPSLKWFDLDCFSDFPSICCGMIPFHRQFSKLNLRYCLLIEPWLFCPSILQSPALRSCSTIAGAYRKVIAENQDKQFFVHLSNYVSLSGGNVNYVFRRLPMDADGTDHVLNRFSPFGGSFHASLALAYYLGFSKVYLMGFDACTLQPARNRHWYELGEGILFEPPEFATDFLAELRKTIEIYAISANSHSRNVTHIDYERYTGRAPRFQESFELMDRAYLEILATYPHYNIF